MGDQHDHGFSNHRVSLMGPDTSYGLHRIPRTNYTSGSSEIRTSGFSQSLKCRFSGDLEVRKSGQPDFQISWTPNPRILELRNFGNSPKHDFLDFRFFGLSNKSRIQKSFKTKRPNLCNPIEFPKPYFLSNVSNVNLRECPIKAPGVSVAISKSRNLAKRKDS